MHKYLVIISAVACCCILYYGLLLNICLTSIFWLSAQPNKDPVVVDPHVLQFLITLKNPQTQANINTTIFVVLLLLLLFFYLQLTYRKTKEKLTQKNKSFPT